ncbi:dicarboxylate/amino acid:cation symporter [Novosphingobium sp. G106]|uniref:dicarboxylate/amino acid:cation symporter n=1 Tax=Novosphingobium sp. G106 TaxID=2849500 RepID=UPI001C2CE795|nr:cation:dicarboxylase symporter family transporter [Novosphingobium sp. G106]MBV1689605.1 dicarboxylate/amino acid:cation symporter [Novosphingobium sp. G106]
MAETDQTTASFPEIRVPALWTFAGLAGGLMAGLLLRGTAIEPALLAVAQPIGTLWLRALQMTILPLVSALLFTGIVQTVAAAQAGALARRTLGLFALVLTAGTLFTVVALPLLLESFPVPREAVAALGGMAKAEPGTVPGLAEFLLSLVPANVFEAAAQNAMVPVIVFISFFALAATRLAAPQRDLLAGFFAALAAAMMVVIGWVLALAPVGVFTLAFAVAAQSGSAVIAALAHYIVLVAAMGFSVFLGGYLVAVVGGRLPLGAFARAVVPSQTVAFSTQSSLASLPAMLAACQTLGVARATADFVLPLAVALFRATSPAMNVAVVIYVAYLTNTPITAMTMAAGVGVALVTTWGTISLPGTISFIASTGPIALAMGVPLEPLALLVAVEMLPDVMRTVGNVTMDVAVTATVDRRTRLRSGG